MSFVMINTTNNSIIRNLNKWVRGDRREYAKNNNWFIRKLGPNTYLMEANGAKMDVFYKSLETLKTGGA